MDDPCANNLKQQNPDLSEAFPGITSDACANLMRKQDGSYAGDQLLYDMQIQSYIQTNGYPILYYPYLYEIEKSEKIHGEHSAAGYGQPFQTIMMMTIEDAPSWVGEMGVDSDATVTGWLHIKTFKNNISAILQTPDDSRYIDYSKIYNLNYIQDRDIVHAIEPKVKDLFQLMTFGCDREYDRGNKIFEITNKEDELFSQNMNPAMGHYVWRITAKRYRYSYEDGMSRLDEKSLNNPYLGVLGEKGNHQVHDNLSVYKMFLANEGITSEEADDLLTFMDKDLITESGVWVENKEYKKVYKQDINKQSKHEFDMEKRIPDFYKNKQSEIHWNGVV